MPRPKKHVKLNPRPLEPINPREKARPDKAARQLEARAARNGWDTPPEQQARIIDLLVGELFPRGKPKKGVEPLSRPEMVKISRTLIAASIAQQKIDLNKHRDNVGGLKINPDAIGRAQALAAERKIQREQDKEAEQRDRDRRGKRK